jgi:hypothetical protein
MLKIYDKLEDVPEALREHYKLIDGKYVPEVSDDHPLKVTNKTLLNEKNAAESKVSGLETQVTTLKADIESAKASSLPRGHRAVTVADADLLEKLKPHGTVQEVETKLNEHKALKEADEARKATDHLKRVAKVLGYNEDAFALLPNLPEFEIRTVDGKETVIAKLKDDKGVITEKPASEFIESTPAIAPLLPALKTASTGIRVPEQTRDTGTKLADDLISKRNQEREQARKDNPNPLMAPVVKPGAQAAAAK